MDTYSLDVKFVRKPQNTEQTLIPMSRESTLMELTTLAPDVVKSSGKKYNFIIRFLTSKFFFFRSLNNMSSHKSRSCGFRKISLNQEQDSFIKQEVSNSSSKNTITKSSQDERQNEYSRTCLDQGNSKQNLRRLKKQQGKLSVLTAVQGLSSGQLLQTCRKYGINTRRAVGRKIQALTKFYREKHHLFAADFPDLPAVQDFHDLHENKDFLNLRQSEDFPDLPETKDFLNLPRSEDFPDLPETQDFPDLPPFGASSGSTSSSPPGDEESGLQEF